jgi:hypothetical protein
MSEPDEKQQVKQQVKEGEAPPPEAPQEPQGIAGLRGCGGERLPGGAPETPEEP